MEMENGAGRRLMTRSGQARADWTRTKLVVPVLRVLGGAPRDVMTAGEVARLFGAPAAAPRPSGAPAAGFAAVTPVAGVAPRAPAPLVAPRDLMNTFGLTLELAVYRPVALAFGGVAQPPVRRDRAQAVVTVLLVASLVLGWGLVAAGAAAKAGGYQAYPVVQASAGSPVAAGSLVIDRAVPAAALRAGDLVTAPAGAGAGEAPVHVAAGRPPLDGPAAGEVGRVVLVLPLAGYAAAGFQNPGVKAAQVALPLLLLVVLFSLASRRRPGDDGDLIARQSQETASPTV